MQGVVFDMFISGTLLYIGLTIIGLDFAILFAVLTALLVVVPYFGAIVGAIPPVLFALTDSPGKALAVLVVYVLVQQIESNVIIPLVMSRTTRLHPALIAIGVVVVGQPVRDRGPVRGGADHLGGRDPHRGDLGAGDRGRAREPRDGRHRARRPGGAVTRARPRSGSRPSASPALAGAPQRDPEL